MPQRPALPTFVPALAFALFGAPAVLVAQYTVPGSLAELPSDRKEKVEEAAREARWGSGRLRIEPWFTLSDAGYYFEDEVQPDGSTDLEGDLSATVGAGLRAYLRAGSRMILAAHGKLDYVYWADRDERRTPLGQYGVGLFGEAGRLGMEVTATRAESQELFTAESLRRAPSQVDALAASFDLQVGRGLFLRFGGSDSSTRVLDPEEQGTEALVQLDRDEQRLFLDTGYLFRGGLVVTLGYEESATDFRGARDRSNDGTAYRFGVDYRANRFTLSGSMAQREIEAAPGSSFGGFDGTTYRVQLGLGQGRRIAPVFYAQRDLVYTLDASSSYALDERVGASLSVSLGRRTTLSGYFETGEQEFRAVGEAATGRLDDLTAWGGQLGITLGRGLRLYAGYRSIEYDSNLPGQDREERSILGGLRFGGKSEGPWY
ncbi:MAG TPA: hypothetical protein VLA75_01575 [Thermoanaerobaculia bacterium]|nr:hypothetical protein [Thermoanaerobaculia bacterium]